MHLIVAHAVAPTIEDLRGMSSWYGQSLPNLHRVVSRWQVAHEDLRGPTTLNTPDERAMATTLGWDAADGQLPLVAWQVEAAPGQAWGRLTPCHWSASAEHIRLADPQSLGLTAQDSQTLLDSVRALWEADGFELVWHSPLTWYVSHPTLVDMPCASLDRVVGRQVDTWLGQDPRLRLLRRLQSETQMVWHAHPLNEQREQQGLPAINSVWLSDCGALKQALAVTEASYHWDVTLRDAAWQGDLQAWQEACKALDQRVAQWCRPDADPALQRLTLCGEQGSRTWVPSSGSRLRWAPWRRLWAATQSPWQEALEGL